MLLLDHAIGVDHSQRILPGVEARNLRDQRARDVDAELVDDVARVLRRERHVLRRERVDRRRPDRRHRKVGRLRDVLAPVEDGRVVACEGRQEEVEHLLVRRGQVDVAAPDPASVRARKVVADGRRLRVVDDDEVVFAFDPRGVELVVSPKDLLLLLAQALRIPLERVVDRLRHVEELVLAVNDPPLRVEAGVAHKRDQRVVDLGDAAAERRRGQMQHALAGERLGQAADLLHQAARGQRRVVAKRLVSDVDVLEHWCSR